MSELFLREYPSIAAFARHVAGLTDDGRRGHSSTADRGHRWDLGADFDTTLQMAQEGGHWEEGARDLARVDVDQMAHGLAEVIEPAMIHAAQGGAVDVGEYLSGSPECWLALEEVSHARPVVRVGVCAVPCANMPAVAVMNRGRAILAIVEALELQGYSVELTAMFIAKGSHAPDYVAATIVKQAGEPWTPEPVAFALAHPAFTRRLGFRALESDQDCNGHAASGGYGRGDIARKKLADYDLFYPYADDPNNWQDGNALDTAKRIASEQQPDLFKH